MSCKGVKAWLSCYLASATHMAADHEGRSKQTCPVKSDRVVHKGNKSGSKVRTRQRYADSDQCYSKLPELVQNNTRQAQMCTVSTYRLCAATRHPIRSQTKQEQFLFSSLARLCQNHEWIHLLSCSYFVPFHVIWSKTGGEREEMKKVHCLLA